MPSERLHLREAGKETVRAGAGRQVGHRALFGVACVACCALPMLLVAGVVSLGALLVGGVAVGAVVALSALAVYGRLVVLDRRSAGPGERPRPGA